MNYEQINEVLQSVFPNGVLDTEVWLGMNLWGSKNRAPHVTMTLADGRRIHLGIRWAKVTGEKK